MIAVHEVEVALITSGATILVAGLGIVAILVQQNRTGKKVDEVIRHTNSVEESVGPDGGARKTTLRQDVREGFARNDADHAELKAGLVGHEVRIKGVEREVGL